MAPLIADNLTCAICFEHLDDPKQLPCGHTFCKKCLARVLKQNPHEAITCPLCRHVTPVEEGDVSSLPTNITLKILVGNFKSATQTLQQKIQPCIAFPTSPSQDTFHAEKKGKKEEIKSRGKCDRHPDDTLHYYCQTCQKKVCFVCRMLECEKTGHEIDEEEDDTKEEENTNQLTHHHGSPNDDSIKDQFEEGVDEELFHLKQRPDIQVSIKDNTYGKLPSYWGKAPEGLWCNNKDFEGLPGQGQQTVLDATEFDPGGAARCPPNDWRKTGYRPFEENGDNVSHSKKKKCEPSCGLLADPPWMTLGGTLIKLLSINTCLWLCVFTYPDIVAATPSRETFTLLEGGSGTMCFLRNWLQNEHEEFKNVKPYYTIRYESLIRPFWAFDEIDPVGFKSQNQSKRFEIKERIDARNGLSVDLMINDVHVIDEDLYVLTVLIPKDTGIVSVEFRKDVRVYSPPGKAKCFIGLSEQKGYIYEIHCKATMGRGDGTLSCFQGGQRLTHMGSISVSGNTIRGVFQMTTNHPVSCCSHGYNATITTESCTDFKWPFENEQPIQTTEKSLRLLPTHGDINDDNPNSSESSYSCPGHFKLSLFSSIFISICHSYLMMY